MPILNDDCTTIPFALPTLFEMMLLFLSIIGVDGKSILISINGIISIHYRNNKATLIDARLNLIFTHVRN